MLDYSEIGLDNIECADVDSRFYHRSHVLGEVFDLASEDLVGRFSSNF